MTPRSELRRILIIDDDELVAESASVALRGDGLICETAGGLATAREALSCSHFDLVLLDVLLPDGLGLDLIEEIRGHSTGVVMMTGVDDIATANIAVGRGADGYLVKPFSRNQLRIQVATSLAPNHAHRRPPADPLTAVRAALVNSGAVCAVIDLELPLVSAVWGAEAALDLQRAALRRLNATLPAVLVAVPVANEIYAAIDAGGASQAAPLGAQIWTCLREPYDIGGHHAMIRPAVGLADVDAVATSALDRAQTACAYARQEGRAGWAQHSDILRDVVGDRLTLAADLSDAIHSDQLTIAYQPQFDLRTGEFNGIEALARWRHALRGDVGPATFVPIAEQQGLINDLGDWVLRRACHDVADRWRHVPSATPNLSVNVSAFQLASDAFVERVLQTLSEADLPAHRLCLEITESIALEHTPALTEGLDALTRNGVRLAVDDLGTGYASFTRLASHAWHQVKLDHSLIAHIEEPATYRIVEAIVGLGQQLQFEVMAEGVENADQAHRLLELGCDGAQGYYFGYPGPLNHIGLRTHFATRSRTP
jgi:EAL domain-containing protein (putative c-di-GMP-specific phosphodiesterase class I)/DNA-binding response OmpR family regulator